MELKTVHIKDMTLKGFDAEIDLQITNPNWFTVRISDLDYHAYISGEEIASGQAEQEIAIPSGSATVVTLPLKVSYGNLGGKLAQILFKGNLEYRLTGLGCIPYLVRKPDRPVRYQGKEAQSA